MVDAHFHPVVSEKRRGIPCHVYFSPELHPDFPKCTLTWRSGTLPSAIFFARITFRSQQRTQKPKSSFSKRKQWQPALLILKAGGPPLPKNTKTSSICFFNIIPTGKGGKIRGQEKIFLRVQLTTSRIGNLTRLILTLAMIFDDHTYIHTYYGRPCTSNNSTSLRFFLYGIANIYCGSVEKFTGFRCAIWIFG